MSLKASKGEARIFQPGLFGAMILFAAGCLVIALCLLAPQGGQAFFSMDSPASWFRSTHRLLQTWSPHMWMPEYWMGQPFGTLPPDQTWGCLLLWDYPWSNCLLVAVDLTVAAVGVFLACRVLGLAWAACVFSGTAWLLTNTMITLVYPGHTGKFITCAWLPMALAFFFHGLKHQKICSFLLSGALLGVAELGWELQLPYYLGLWFVILSGTAFFLQRGGWPAGNGWKVVLGVALIPAAACLTGASAFGRAIFLMTQNQMGGGAVDSAQNWHFATQFYFPPEETLSYLTTAQFFGAPDVYWGRNGAPMFLRLSDDYMGLLVLGFCFLGITVCWRNWPVKLLTLMGAGSLLASFGREGGLYWLLYQLPTMKSHRNPHRWSYFVSLTACLLAAYGVDWFYRRLQERRKEVPGGAEQGDGWLFWERVLLGMGLVGGAIFLVGGGLQAMPEAVARGWYSPGDMASSQAPVLMERTACLLSSLTRTGFFLGVSALSVWLALAWISRWRQSWACRWLAVPWIVLVAVLVADLGHNARRFIRFYDWRQMYEQNDLVNLLRKDQELFRVKALGVQQNQLLNQLVSCVLPYHQIGVVDPPASSRTPSDYALLFDYLARNQVQPEAYLDFFNAKYILSAAPINDPGIKLTPIAQWQNIMAYRRERCLPRVWLVGDCQVVKDGDEQTLKAVFSPSNDMRKTVILDEPPSFDPAMPGTRPGDQMPGRINRVDYQGECRMEIQFDAQIPCWLVMSERWDPDWKAWLDGKPVKIKKGNFLMRVIETPAGSHRLVMKYRPSMTLFWVSVSAMAFFGMVGIICLWRTRRRAA
ncbi:MAG: hypothetical protein PHV34_21595 [Verrucomicrobiae bacterium]|nr:hypothetical protein [Verrucomicrobiae bacterium]